MAEPNPQSVGIVEPQTLHVAETMPLDCGKTIERFDLVYETYGTLNADRSNAVLVCHALSGNHHAAGYHSEDDEKPGWWDKCIGPGKMIDTDHFFVVSPANLGGYNGSTGPGSLHPETGLDTQSTQPLQLRLDRLRSIRTEHLFGRQITPLRRQMSNAARQQPTSLHPLAKTNRDSHREPDLA